MLPPRISSATVSIPVVPHLLHHDFLPLSSPLTFSAISIIPHLHRASIVVLPRLCCGSQHIIFHRPVYFTAVFSLPSRIGSSPHSASFCITLLAQFCPSLLFSLSALIFSLRFYCLFWNGSYLSPLRSAAFFLHLPSLRSTPILSLLSALSTPI